jgi:hypothetical protein
MTTLILVDIITALTAGAAGGFEGWDIESRLFGGMHGLERLDRINGTHMVMAAKGAKWQASKDCN